MSVSRGLLLALGGDGSALAAGQAARSIERVWRLAAAPLVERGVLGTLVGGAKPPRWRRAAILHLAGAPSSMAEEILVAAGDAAWMPTGRADSGTPSLSLAEPITPCFTKSSEAADVDRIQCLVFSNPVDGHETEFNDWYSERHLHDVLDVPGYLSAQRFRWLEHPRLASLPWRYLALYEVAREAYEAAVVEVARRSNTELMPISPAADLSTLYSAHFSPDEAMAARSP